MPVGFGVSTETARSVVKNFKRQRKNYNLPEETLIRRQDGAVTTKSLIRINSKEDLLALPVDGGFAWTSTQPNQELSIDLRGGKPIYKGIDVKGERMSYEGRTELLDVRIGNYRLNAYKEHHNNLCNFTFSVLVGNSYVFDAKNIREHIIQEFNEDVYNTWKKILNKTIIHAKVCVGLARTLSPKVIASPITDESSRRLCKRSGLFVSSDEAFLIPPKYEY